jgi:Na+-driven multidrug efflux pump
MQQVLEMFALTLMYRIVGTIGTLELASYTVLVNLIGAVGLPAWGLGTAGATLVGQALGKRDKDDAARWAWDVIKVGCATIAVLGAPLWIAPELVLSAFIHDAETIEMARLPCRILGLMIIINAVGYMLASMLNGAGDVKRVMYVNLAMQYFVLLPGAYLLGPMLGYGLLGIWLVHQLGYRAGQSAIFALMWRRGRWSRIAI